MIITHTFTYNAANSFQVNMYRKIIKDFAIMIGVQLPRANKLNELTVTEGDPRFPFEFNQYSTEELIEELKTRNLGVYPLELPFASIPKPE